MIRIDKNSVEMRGDIPALLAEITSATKQLYDHMSETVGKEVAGSVIDHIVELAKISEDEIARNAVKLLKELGGEA